MIDWLPKSAIVSVCVVLFAVVGYFVRRDYQRIGDYMATSNGRLAAIESYQRKTVTVDEHRESMSGVHRKIDALFEKNADQIGAQNTRLVIIETKMGAHDFEEEET